MGLYNKYSEEVYGVLLPLVLEDTEDKIDLLGDDEYQEYVASIVLEMSKILWDTYGDNIKDVMKQFDYTKDYPL